MIKNETKGKKNKSEKVKISKALGRATRPSSPLNRRTDKWTDGLTDETTNRQSNQPTE